MTDNGLKSKIKFGLKANLSREWKNDLIHSLIRTIKAYFPYFFLWISNFGVIFKIILKNKSKYFKQIVWIHNQWASVRLVIGYKHAFKMQWKLKMQLEKLVLKLHRHNVPLRILSKTFDFWIVWIIQLGKSKIKESNRQNS